MYVPYNAYTAVYQAKQKDLVKPNHLNPDLVRWELHRVWVVEATLREGKRHVYSKRAFYLDEDSWAALASDEYDARGQLYRTGFAYMAPSYDLPAPYTDMFGHYDLIARIYALTGFIAETGGLRHTKPRRTASGRRIALPAPASADSDGPSRERDVRMLSTSVPTLRRRACRGEPPRRRTRATCWTRRRPRARSPRARCSTGSHGLTSASIAVGQRGHVLYSDDAGKTWRQADVPVSSDLVAVHFPSASAGWAVGHDGVVLHSADGGATWTRQFDGRALGAVLVDYYTRAAAGASAADAKRAERLLAEARRFAEQGAENPFLDVWFENARAATSSAPSG